MTRLDQAITDCAACAWRALDGELFRQQSECDIDRASKSPDSRTYPAITARIDAIKRARAAIDSKQQMPDLSAAIIAINAVYRIGHIAAHERTALLIEYDESLNAALDIKTESVT